MLCPKCGRGDTEVHENTYDDERPWLWCFGIDLQGCGMGMRLSEAVEALERMRAVLP